MLNFFKKKNEAKIYAPVDGKCIDIIDVKDEVFASKMLGEGFAVIPDNCMICSPSDGVITMIFPTKHAFGVRMKDGKDILVHIGIDTVNLGGKGFEILKTVNQKVKAGDPIIKIDKDYIESQHYDLTTVVVMTDQKEMIEKRSIGENVCCHDLIINYS